MNQIELLDAAKQQQGLTSDYSLAQRLGITTARISDLRKGRKPVDEAEIFRLADMAQIDPHLAAAGVKIDREKNPAKRAYWERISTQFAVASAAAATVVIEKISGNFENLLSRYNPRPA
jgi:transcriptional regulator with XRE-family HTH domain